MWDSLDGRCTPESYDGLLLAIRSMNQTSKNPKSINPSEIANTPSNSGKCQE